MKETKFYTNLEKKTVVCVITIHDDYFGEIHRFEGKAKCSPDDNFDEAIGREIAQNRAFIKMKTHFKNLKKSIRLSVANRIKELMKYGAKVTAGILRNESEINTAKARIRELGTSK
jgi:ribonuclease I